MDITTKLMQYRYQFTLAIVGSLILGLLSYAIPRVLTILAYFWPLFASTAVFLLLIIAFGGVSHLATDSHGEKAGEGLLDYVAGRPEHFGDAQRYD
ncbi:Transmembrane protein [Melia azedarach]|uniref:Transmembrane protein n=2 Tax=Melia azedarach TaxID=155640 RepID=A0ACC1WY27_MELAZ|nr:Transmembrane protein [Melia azedarach]KAJ4704090.1 Transmembrane protein [Melia azedarach]